MATADLSWKDDILKTLINIFSRPNQSPKSAEKLIRLLFMLDYSDKKAQQNGDSSQEALSPFWNTLKTAHKLKSESLLKHYANRISENTLEADLNAKFVETIDQTYCNYRNGTFDNFDNFMKEENDDFLAKVWAHMSQEAKVDIFKAINLIIIGNRVICSVDSCVSLLNRTGKKISELSLAAFQQAFQFWSSLYRWQNGRISGTRCFKNCVESVLQYSLGLTCLRLGSQYGALFGGMTGTFFGAIVGCAFASATIINLAKPMLARIFNLPENERVEKAYEFLGVAPNATLLEIKNAYNAKALKVHPDKGGSAEEFYELQKHMAAIGWAKRETN